MASRPDQLSPNFVFWVRLAPAEQFENRDSLPCRSFNASPAGTCRSCNRSAGLWRAKFFLPSARSEENRNDQDRDDIDDFDHRIDGRSRGILVGIADGITGDRCRVRERPFAAEISFFDEFLSIIPRTAARCHGDGDEQSSDDRSDEQTAQNYRSKWFDGCDCDDKDQGQKRRHNHFAQGSFGHDVDASAVLWCILASQNSWFRFQLPTHFAHDRAGGFTYSVHAKRRENKRQQTAEKETDDHLWFVQGKLEHKRFAVAHHMGLQFLNIRSEENERGQPCRRDRVSFGYGFHRVADRVQL